MNIPKSFSNIIEKINPIELKEIILNYYKHIDFNLTWDENGLDSLDMIEFVMILEKKFDITICEDFISTLKPIELVSIVSLYQRNKKLDLLLKNK